MLTYKGFTATIAFDADDEIFVGRVLGINDVVGFHAESVKALKTAFHEAVDDYVETCAKVGKHPEKRASGNLMLRVAPEVHAQATIAAEAAGKSLNQWAEELFRWAVQGELHRRPSTTMAETVNVGRDAATGVFGSARKRTSPARRKPEKAAAR
jgi:predicted HicB family RNase H-like nuclease